MKKRFYHSLKSTLVSRRGLGVELALLVLMVVFSLSGLLVSTALLEKNHLEQERTALQQRIELDALGEEFCKTPTSWTLHHEHFTSQIQHDDENNRIAMHIYLKSDDPETPGPCVLTIVLKDNGGNCYTVEQWTHY